MGEDVAKTMDKTESWSRGCRVGVEVREQQRARGCQLRHSQPLEGPSSCGCEGMVMTEQPQAGRL